MLDWHTFLKLDNAATIDFLSSYASALATEGLISDRSVENLKISLATVTPQLATTDKSILTLLAENDAEFIQILTARYGVTGFAWNHMRFSTRNLLSESCATLASWADQTLKKAEKRRKKKKKLVENYCQKLTPQKAGGGTSPPGKIRGEKKKERDMSQGLPV